jgi:hypothetical protein
MKKSALFISTVLTTFVLVVLAGAVSAYRTYASSSQAAAKPAAPMAQVAPTAAPTPTVVSPQEAAKIAAQYIHRSDLYAVESKLFKGASAYMVTFSSGDVVYVSLQGQVLSVIAPPSVSVTTDPLPVPPTSNPSSSSEHENDDHD